MFTSAVFGETLMQKIEIAGIPAELVLLPATIWCGTLGYAKDNTDEPDISALLQHYQSNCHIPKNSPANPGWDCCISIDYWQNGAVPRGICFANQVLTERQNPSHDVYIMPASLYIRLLNTREIALAAFNRETCELWELFGFIKDNMTAYGYSVAANGAQEIEMYHHAHALSYAYVPVTKSLN